MHTADLDKNVPEVYFFSFNVDAVMPYCYINGPLRLKNTPHEY